MKDVWEKNVLSSPARTKNSGCGQDTSQKPTEILSAEHRVIERVLDIIEKLAAQPPRDALDDWKKILDVVSVFADQCHHLKEEKVLFPAMEQHGIPRDGGPIGVMLMEHEEGRSFVRSMKAAVSLVENGNAAAAEPLVGSARAYLRLLREHIQKEDDILFRIADEVIPADEQKLLVGSFIDHEVSQIGVGVHDKYLRIVEGLEAKHH